MNPQPLPESVTSLITPSVFEAERAQVLDLPLEGVNNSENRLKAREHAAKLIDGELYKQIYRTRPDLVIEDDLTRLLPAYTQHDNPSVEWNLRTLRRWAMRRYAFCLAEKVNERLNRVVAGERFWLMKDFALPRMAFAMLIGYGAMLGAGKTVEWLGNFSGWAYGVILTLSASAILGLVHVNVRHQIGRDRATNSRTALVCAICCGWIWIGVGAIAALSRSGTFDLSQSVLCSTVAMLLGIVGQFFFTGNTSIAEPL